MVTAPSCLRGAVSAPDQGTHLSRSGHRDPVLGETDPAVVVHASTPTFRAPGPASRPQARPPLHLPRSHPRQSPSPGHHEQYRGRNELSDALVASAPSGHAREPSTPRSRVVALHAKRASRPRTRARRAPAQARNGATAHTPRTRARTRPLRHRTNRRRRPLGQKRMGRTLMTRPNPSTLFGL